MVRKARNTRGSARGELIKDLALISMGVVGAIVLVQAGILDALLYSIGRVELAAFLAGIFFTSAFTIAPSSIALARLAEGSPLPIIALWGALGAVLGDLIIFFFIRDRFAEHLTRSFKPSFLKHLMTSFHFGFLKWLSPLLGAAIIASPLPDELGLALLGISRTKVAILIPVTFVMNGLGIYLVAWMASTL